MAEVKLSFVDVGHLRETAPERIKSDHVRVHLPDSLGQGIDMFLQDSPRLRDLSLLRGEFVRPLGCLSKRATAGLAFTECVPQVEGSTEQGHGRDGRDRERHRVREVHMTRTTLATTEENDIHAERSRTFESIAFDRPSVTGTGPRQTMAAEERLCTNLFILATPLS
jgi:hypothetical protein